MSISLNTAISALDAPSSLLPFFVKDAFDITGRTVMAQKEGGGHEAREKFIEEAGTSLFWIGGIPAVRWIANKIYNNKIDSDIHYKRINTKGIQSYFAQDLLEKSGEKKFKADDLKNIVLGGEKLQAVKEKLSHANFRVNETNGLYGKYHIGVTTAAVLINLLMLSVALPQLNWFLSRKIISKEAKQQKENNLTFGNNKNINEFGQSNKTKSKNPAFSGWKELLNVKEIFKFTNMAEKAQLNPVNGMLLLDYGISGSRIAITPRNNHERVENAIKEGGIIFFFYFAADIIKNWIAKGADKLFKTPIDLDYKVLNSKDLLETLTSNHDKNAVLNFVAVEKDEIKDEVKVIKLIDEQLAKSSEATKKEDLFKNFTLKMAQQEGLIDVEYDSALKKWIRHSKKYIQTDKIIKLNEDLKNFYENVAKKSEGILHQNMKAAISRTKKVKIASIAANIAICCASLSYIVPKIQYLTREYRTQTKSAPGILHYQKLAENNMI